VHVQAGQFIGGRYRLEERIGQGGGGTVWRATDTTLPRTVAVKQALSAGGGHDSEPVERLHREAEFLAGLNHPNIVTLFDVVQEGTEWWLVMEYIPSGSLADQGTLPPERAALLGVQIAGALEAVHRTGVVHGDIKPGNVLVTQDGHAKLADFGASRTVHADMTLTETGGRVAGTPAYMAPEVANGGSPVPASDVFSLGATLFAAVEGGSPYGYAENPLVLLRRAASGQVAESRGGGALAPILSRLMNSKPARRPTAAEARRLLEAVAGPVPSETSETASRPTGTEPTVIDVSRRPFLLRPVVVAGAAAVVLAVAGGVFFGLLSGSSPGKPRPASTPVPPAVPAPQMVDICAYHDETKLARFGKTELDPFYGEFNRCDVLVHPRGGGEVDVKLEIHDPDSAGEPSGPIEKQGAIEIRKDANEDGECDRTLVLPGKSVVSIEVSDDKNAANLCAIADTAVKSAIPVMSHGTPLRTTRPPSASLIWSNACALVDARTLSLFPGVDALHPAVDFGDWQCEWTSTTSGDKLLVRFDQSSGLSAEDGSPMKLGTHDAFVKPNGYGPDTCQVLVFHRRFTVNGDEKTEQLLVAIMGKAGETASRRCRTATAIAGYAAAKLPRA
jgi:eukaryotic-like serine/threonine-protein kinase